MRILLSCLQDLRPHAIPAYRFWADFFRHGLTEAGYEWAEVPGVDWAEGISGLAEEEAKAWCDRTWSQTLDWLAAESRQGRHVDLFLSYLYPEQVEAAALAEIRRRGIPCINFFCDNVRQFDRVPAVYGAFDLHWVPEFKALPMYALAGLRYCHAPMPMWVPPEFRTPGEETLRQATFIGSRDDLRHALLGQALRTGADIRIGGKGWRPTDEGTEVSPTPLCAAPGSQRRWRNQAAFVRQHGWGGWGRKMFRKAFPTRSPVIPDERLLPPIDGPDYLRLTRESEVTLGINRVPTFRHSRRRPETYSRLRDIEAPMLGACYLTEWTDGLDQLYDLDKEIATFRSAEEMVGKLEELRANPEKRRSLRFRGQERALSSLTIGQSMAKLTTQVGLPARLRGSVPRREQRLLP